MDNANPIPGSSVVGWGFDIFGTYSTESKTQQLFAMRDDGKQWSYNGTPYLVPDNVVVELVSQSEGESSLFESRSEVQTYFSAKAGIHGSYGGFSGQFEASYDMCSKHDTAYTYGLYQMNFQAWRLDLQEVSQEALAPWVVSDPDWQVPESFNPSTRSRFYRFFQKYGTHYVSSVSVGFRMYFSLAVERSYESNSQTISSKLDLEYKALFSDTKATAEATWKKVGQSWADNTLTSVSAQGGTSQLLDAIEPGYLDNYQQLLSEWRVTAEQMPAAVDFKLRPIWLLFTGAQATALEEAYHGYLHERIYGEAKSDNALIMVRGKAQVPATPTPPRTSGFQVCVLDRGTLEPVLNQYLPLQWEYEELDGYSAKAYQVLEPYMGPEYLVVLATYGMLGYWFPRGALYQALLSIGAGGALKQWEAMSMDNDRNSYGVNYLLVGTPTAGPGTGVEAISVGDTSSQWSLSDATYMQVECPTAIFDVLVDQLVPPQSLSLPRLAKSKAAQSKLASLLRGDTGLAHPRLLRGTDSTRAARARR
ncbi:MAC/perforin domain-containing protein [Myxococcus sp. 1LA]